MNKHSHCRKIQLLAGAVAPFLVLIADFSLAAPILEPGVYRPPVEVSETGARGRGGAPVSALEQQYRMQLLQQEIMELRGLVERLRHEQSRQKSIQDERYLEMDARLQQLMQTQPSPQPSPGEPPASRERRGFVGTMNEKEVYDITQVLIRKRQYDQAIMQLESLIERFPNGDYTPISYYWMGQIYAARPDPDFEKARQALAQVISYFPEHEKVPDAAYALGKVYHTLGDCARAVELLQQVIDNYPGKSAATLAENYLSESVDCP